MSWPEAAELVGCPVPTIDWHTRTGRIETRPFNGPRPTLKRASVEEFALWWAERQAERAARLQASRPCLDRSLRSRMIWSSRSRLIARGLVCGLRDLGTDTAASPSAS